MWRLLVMAALAGCSSSGAPSIPEGWTGYVELWEGSGHPDACSAGFTSLTSAGSAGLTAPLDCHCSCYGYPNCPATPMPIPSGLTTTWAVTAYTCEPTPTCESNGSCKPSSPFFQGHCIYAPGDVPCPDHYGDRHVYYTELMDTRTCCSCYYHLNMCVDAGIQAGSAVATKPFTYCCAP